MLSCLICRRWGISRGATVRDSHAVTTVVEPSARMSYRIANAPHAAMNKMNKIQNENKHELIENEKGRRLCFAKESKIPQHMRSSRYYIHMEFQMAVTLQQ